MGRITHTWHTEQQTVTHLCPPVLETILTVGKVQRAVIADDVRVFQLFFHDGQLTDDFTNAVLSLLWGLPKS